MIEELELLRIGEIPDPGRSLGILRGFQGDLTVQIRLVNGLGSITRRARLIESRELCLLRRLELRDDKIVLILQVRSRLLLGLGAGRLLLSRERLVEKGSR